MLIESPGKVLLTHPIFKHFINTHLFFIISFYSLIILFLLTQHINTIYLPMAFFMVVTGILLWTFVEYVMHRFVFHGTWSQHAWFKKFQFFMHGYHHGKPTDASRLVLPIVLTLPVTVTTYYVYQLIFGDYGSFVLIGFIMGYLFYDITHYTVHRFRPKTALGKYLKCYHFHHHFRDHQCCYGVTNPLWDFIFKTRHS